jgi:DnaJ-domain-containing protein 1
MMRQDDIRRLLHELAAHPVLPPTEQLPPNDAALHTVLADLAAGERSRYADLLRHVADARGIAFTELAHRAEFLLACILLPRAGTYYEVLGVVPTASPDEIRRRWATLIQRYHPDRLSASGGWVDEQARRLIDAYQTLKDPERRRRYDAEIEPQPATLATPKIMRRPPRPLEPQRWRWVPVALVLGGFAAALAIYTWRTPPPLPQAALPPAPKLQEGQHQAIFAEALTLARAPKPSTGVVEVASSPTPVPVPEDRRVSEPALISRPVDATPVPASQQRKPPEMPRPAVKPRQRSASSGKPPETTPMHGSATRQAQPDDRGETPRTVARGAVRPEPVEERMAAPGTSSDPPQGVKGQPPPLKTQPMLARITPDDSGAKSPRLADHPLALIESFRAAYEGKDLDTMMRLFAPVPRERNAVGRSAVQDLYTRNFAALDRIQYQLSHLAMTSPAANGALIVQGRFRIRAVRRDNPSDPVNATGTIRWVLRSEADALRIAEIDYELSQR